MCSMRSKLFFCDVTYPCIPISWSMVYVWPACRAANTSSGDDPVDQPRVTAAISWQLVCTVSRCVWSSLHTSAVAVSMKSADSVVLHVYWCKPCSNSWNNKMYNYKPMQCQNVEHQTPACGFKQLYCTGHEKVAVFWGFFDNMIAQ